VVRNLKAKLEVNDRLPRVLDHQEIRFETSQSWNRGRGPVSGDDGNSNGDNYKHDAYDPKKKK
jgi:hypothetical protein